MISIGYVKQSITQAKNIYIFSQEGFLLFCQIADIKEDYSEFEKNYFGSNKLISITPMRYELGFWNILLRTFKSIINFSPQYSCCNNKYRIDFYTPKYNLAVEYDEKGHRNKMSEDKIREQEIHNELGCNFIRVKKGKELEGINNIFKYILNNKKEMFFNG